MTAYFGRRYMLSASHRLHCDGLTEDQNRAVYGKCNNPHGHGHNYIVEVLIGGAVSPETGMVINLVDLDAVVQTHVLDRFDLVNLNLDPLFTAQVPTTENLCREIFRIVRGSLPTDPPDLNLEYVRVEETENNFFQCYNL